MTTPRGSVLLGAVRRNFELLVELDKSAPHDVDLIVAAMVAHLRAWRPMALLVVEQTEEVKRG